MHFKLLNSRRKHWGEGASCTWHNHQMPCSLLSPAAQPLKYPPKRACFPSRHLLHCCFPAHCVQEQGGWQGRQQALPSPMDQLWHNGKCGLRFRNSFSALCKNCHLDSPGKNLSQTGASIIVHVFCSSVTPCSYCLIYQSHNFFALVISNTSLETATPQAVHTDISQYLSPAIFFLGTLN